MLRHCDVSGKGLSTSLKALYMLQDEAPIPVLITAYSDKTFEYVRLLPDIITLFYLASTCCLYMIFPPGWSG